MKTLTLKIDEFDMQRLKEYVNINNLTVSNFVRDLIIDKLDENIDINEEKRILEVWEKAKKEKFYDHKDVWKELGI